MQTKNNHNPDYHEKDEAWLQVENASKKRQVERMDAEAESLQFKQSIEGVFKVKFDYSYNPVLKFGRKDWADISYIMLEIPRPILRNDVERIRRLEEGIQFVISAIFKVKA